MTRIENVTKDISTPQLYQELKESVGDDKLKAKVKWNKQEGWVEVDAPITEAQLQSLVDSHTPRPGGQYEGDQARLFELLSRYCLADDLTQAEERELQKLERKRLWTHLGGVLP